MLVAQVSAINAAMSSLIKTLNVSPRERSIVSRERSKKVIDFPLGHQGIVLHVPIVPHECVSDSGGAKPLRLDLQAYHQPGALHRQC